MGLIVDRELPRAQDVAAAAVLALPFSLYLVVMRLAASPTEAMWARADPILHILPPAITTWIVPVTGGLLAAAWWRHARPERERLVRAAKWAALGALAAVLVAGAMRLTAGPTLPAFIPSEESAAPGYVLSMTAGFGEELIFRLMMLPLLLVALGRRYERRWAVAAAVVLTGLGFALLHELGPGAWSGSFFATRLLFPGCVMSLAFVLLEPSFVVTAHGLAHVVIPALFTG